MIEGSGEAIHRAHYPLRSAPELNTPAWRRPGRGTGMEKSTHRTLSCPRCPPQLPRLHPGRGLIYSSRTMSCRHGQITLATKAAANARRMLMQRARLQHPSLPTSTSQGCRICPCNNRLVKTGRRSGGLVRTGKGECDKSEGASGFEW